MPQSTEQNKRKHPGGSEEQTIESLIEKKAALNIEEIENDANSKESDNPEVSNNTDESYEAISEEEALKKYKYGTPKYNKAMEMFMNSFKANIENINFDLAGKLCKMIVDQLISDFADTFPKEVRSKSHNLKENSKLCSNVYSKTLGTAEFVKMTPEELQSEELRSKNTNYIKNSILESQVAKVGADTDMFQCGKCKQKKCTYSQLQTRSCDEPMTTFVTCTVCGNRWKF